MAKKRNATQVYVDNAVKEAAKTGAPTVNNITVAINSRDSTSAIAEAMLVQARANERLAMAFDTLAKHATPNVVVLEGPSSL